MASMWSVAKFLTLTTRARTSTADKETDKIPNSTPLPAPAASEVAVVPDQPKSEPTKVSPSQLPSRTQSKVTPSVRENTPKEESTWTSESAIVHEPEDTQSLETKVASKASSKRQGSTSPSPSLHKRIDLPTSNPWIDVDPPKQEEQKIDNLPEKLLETNSIVGVETLSGKESLAIDNTPAYAEPREEQPDLLRKDEVDLAAALLEMKRLANDNRRLQNKLRTALSAVDEKTEIIDQVGREKVQMEDVRRACEESEEVAKKETQRVKVMIAVERHSHNERVKEFQKEKEELMATLGAAQSNALAQLETLREQIGIFEGRLEDEAREMARLREDIKAVTFGKEEAILQASKDRNQMEEILKTEMEGVRKSCGDNEEAARKEVQRVKGLIAVERHSHSARVKELEGEKEELIGGLDTARKEAQRVKGMIAVERHTHSERVKEFKDEKDGLVAELVTVRKEAQRIKGLIAIERHSHSERVKEFKDEKDLLVAALDTAKKETQRVKSLIAVERHSHSEQVRVFKEEKDELSAALDATRSKLLAAVAGLEAQEEDIRNLKGRLEDNLIATEKLQHQYHEQETTTKRLQAEIVEERNKSQPLKVKLSEIQSKAITAERDNRLLREQLVQLQNPVAAVGRFVSSIWS